MTVSGLPLPAQAELVAAPPPPTLDSADDVASSALAQGVLRHADAICLSVRASALVRAGLAARAFVLRAADQLYRRVLLGPGRVLELEGGIYRLA